jgi:uncharacterized protein (TIGR00661 family)
MKTIAYYISDYGYGHATRSTALIRELLNQQKEIKVIICHSFAMQFLKESLKDQRVEFREITTDVGYFLKENSLMPDPEILSKEYSFFVQDWKVKQGREKTFLKENQVDLVISDISPLPFQSACELGIPSLGISNFTWYTAYQGFLSTQELHIFYRAYKYMTYFFSLAASKEPEWTANRKEYGFFARTVDANEVRRISKELNPNGKKKIIFVGFGMKINTSFLENLPLWNSPDCVFIISSNVDIKPRGNMYKIPFNYLETQNYIASADLVITKAGWGTVSEAVTSQTPLLILERDTMLEDRHTVTYMESQQLCHTINWSDLNNLIINKMEIESNFRRLAVNKNESNEIASNILSILDNNRDFL